MELKPSSVASLISCSILLIVPYGIETCSERAGSYRRRVAFNRTLWN